MTLSDRDIKKYIKEKKIKIKPKPDFKKQLGPCSLDLHLGSRFKVFKHNKHIYLDLKSKIPIEQLMAEVFVPKNQAFILQPQDFVLGVTQESIELSADLMARLDGRSSLGRLGVVVHSTAARFDPGWRGKAVMEIGNLGKMPVALYPGMRICAFTFELLSSPSDSPYFKSRDKKYLHQKTPKASDLSLEFKKNHK